MTGIERHVEENLSVYVRTGRKLSDMHIALLTQTGKKVRIIRGHRLKGINTPIAGVRYDGM